MKRLSILASMLAMACLPMMAQKTGSKVQEKPDPNFQIYLCLFHSHPDSSAATRTRPDSYSPRAFVSSHSRKLANAQTERSVAATSAVLVTESELSSTYQHCYWMR